MQNKTALTLISVSFIVFLLFQSLHPYGYLYPYLHPQELETEQTIKKKPTIVIPFLAIPPQKVADVLNSDPTRDTYQRKVFYDGANFFIIFRGYNPTISPPRYPIMYSVSENGLLWNTRILFDTDIPPYAGGLDVNYPNRGAKDGAGAAFNLSIAYTTSSATYWRPYVISGQTLVAGSARGSGQPYAQAGTIVSNLNGVYEYILIHRDTTYQYVRTIKEPVNDYDASVALSYGGTTTGGNQLLPYKTSSPYKMLALCKGGDNKLYYNIVNEPTATFASSFKEIATLGTGFNDFCGASEAQNIGDPERVHLVYIKSSGELCYRKFENDAWSNEEVLVSEGASYPVIAVGKGKLYVFYVKDGIIYLLQKTSAGWQAPLPYYTWEHKYNNPAYLSTNQNVQNGKICLVWTEGTSAPYQVWFTYIND